MDIASNFSTSLSRLESALSRLEQATAAVDQVDSANGALTALEAERDLLMLRHRRLVQSTERTVADLDALIASAG